MKIRALAVWINRKVDRYFDDDGTEVLVASDFSTVVWLDENLERHAKSVGPDDSAPVFEVVSHPNFFVEIDDEPGSYRLKPKPEAREIPPEGLGGAASGSISVNLKRPNR